MLPPIEMLSMIKMMTQSLFIQFFKHFLGATVHAYNSNNLILTTRGLWPSQFKFLPTNLNVQAGEIRCFCSKMCNFRPSSKFLMQ